MPAAVFLICMSTLKSNPKQTDLRLKARGREAEPEVLWRWRPDKVNIWTQWPAWVDHNKISKRSPTIPLWEAEQSGDVGEDNPVLNTAVVMRQHSCVNNHCSCWDACFSKPPTNHWTWDRVRGEKEWGSLVFRTMTTLLKTYFYHLACAYLLSHFSM